MLTERLAEAAAKDWEAALKHPFVRELGRGTLAREAFQRFLEQDWLFLRDYARLFALAAAKSRDLQAMRQFAGLLGSTLEQELGALETVAQAAGLDPHTFDRLEKNPTTQAYTDFLVRTAFEKDATATLASALACHWGYGLVGRELAQDPPADPLYAQWIAEYASEAYWEQLERFRSVLDSQGEVEDDRLDELREIFRLGARYEARFFEACYYGESWQRT
ncbi:thiaminase II [soil metagenome]|jgi:thiaminase/transcriptional activator TenA